MNSALQALASNSAGDTEPSTTYAYQWWYDETNDILKIRNSANDAWIDFLTFDQATDTWSLASLDVAGDAEISGSLLVGCTSLPSASVAGSAFVATSFDHELRMSASIASNNALAKFFNPNGTVGSISTSGSTTSYNTSSDERLKENIADAQPASDLVDGIQVREFDWKADGEHQRYGMVAQELETVAPEAVSKGETEDDMWSVDYSKLVPMLVKEIQDLRRRVSELENTQ
jgi:hypothetical protein